LIVIHSATKIPIIAEMIALPDAGSIYAKTGIGKTANRETTKGKKKFFRRKPCISITLGLTSIIIEITFNQNY
tara:strand:- start:448 stop:666 length:219 start_codon:yes stop_codon:yes gene_type:complete